MNAIQPPLLVVVDGDHCWFKTIEETDGYFESYDIHLMTGYDSLARKLKFSAGKTHKRKYLVDIELESDERDAQSFRRLIIDGLIRTASAKNEPLQDKRWDELSLEELMQESMVHWHWETSFFFNFDELKTFLSRLFRRKNDTQ